MTDIPIAVPDLRGNEASYVEAALKSTWISSSGEFLDRFEHEFAELCEAEYCLAVSNGTVALHLAMLALGIGPGDEVIVPSLTYIATANAVKYVGAKPVFVDVNSHDWCIDPDLVSDAVTPRTRAVIPVHIYGQPADIDSLQRVCSQGGIALIEDAAEAPFATYRDRPVGGLGDMATFSFYGNKILTSGEGGALTIRDQETYKVAKQIRGQGMDPTHRYNFPILGHNFRLTNVASAILCAQLERKSEMIESRRVIYSVYDNLLSDIPGIQSQPRVEGTVAAPWLYCILIDESRTHVSRDDLMRALVGRGIETRPFFPPVHLQGPYVADNSGRRLAVTDYLARSGMNLPTFSGMSEEAATAVCFAIREIIEHAAL
jgi:perosamine synthetase